MTVAELIRALTHCDPASKVGVTVKPGRSAHGYNAGAAPIYYSFNIWVRDAHRANGCVYLDGDDGSSGDL